MPSFHFSIKSSHHDYHSTLFFLIQQKMPFAIKTFSPSFDSSIIKNYCGHLHSVSKKIIKYMIKIRISFEKQRIFTARVPALLFFLAPTSFVWPSLRRPSDWWKWWESRRKLMVELDDLKYDWGWWEEDEDDGGIGWCRSYEKWEDERRNIIVGIIRWGWKWKSRESRCVVWWLLDMIIY